MIRMIVAATFKSFFTPEKLVSLFFNRELTGIFFGMSFLQRSKSKPFFSMSILSIFFMHPVDLLMSFLRHSNA